MSKTALLEAPRLAGPIPGQEGKVIWAYRRTPSSHSGSAKQAPPPAPTLAERLRAHLSSLTALEASALFTLVHRRATGEDTLLKWAAGETGVSEALIVKIAKKLGFVGFRQLREALGEHNRLAQADLHEEFCVAEGAYACLQKVLRAAVRALEQGLTSVSPEALERAADCLHAGRQRDFYGEGRSGPVARDAPPPFLPIRAPASLLHSTHPILIHTSPM